ncbi:MAG: hypothetical protein AABX39_06315 [Nanoarchaeota archaeon]
MVLLIPLIFYIVVILASIVLLFKAADLIVYGISNYAKKLGLSDAIIGLVVVAMAASLPEMIASVTGLAIDEIDVTLGTIIGTNMVHAALVVGLLSIIGKKMNLECEILDKSKLLIWALFVLPFILMSDGMLSRADGIILVAGFIAYITVLWKKEGTLGRMKKNVTFKTIYKDSIIFIGSLLALLIAGALLVFGGVRFANLLDIPAYFISLVVIGLGSAIPDLAVGLKSVFQKHQEIGIGDILGSTMIEFLLFFGVVAIFHPLKIDVSNILTAGIFLITSMTLLMYFLKKKVMTWKEGLIMVGIYLLFVVVEWWKVMGGY